jgi:hypothetical protein
MILGRNIVQTLGAAVVASASSPENFRSMSLLFLDPGLQSSVLLRRWSFRGPIRCSSLLACFDVKEACHDRSGLQTFPTELIGKSVSQLMVGGKSSFGRRVNACEARRTLREPGKRGQRLRHGAQDIPGVFVPSIYVNLHIASTDSRRALSNSLRIQCIQSVLAHKEQFRTKGYRRGVDL